MHGDRGSLRVRERPHRRAERPGGGGPFGCLGRAGACGRGVARLVQAGRVAAAGGLVQGQPGDDGVQPGPELAVAAEPGQSLPGGQERVLGGVLRVVVVVQHGERDMVGPQGMTAHQLIEGPRVTLLTAPDQHLVRCPLAGSPAGPGVPVLPSRAGTGQDAQVTRSLAGNG